ncbi:hypothetical protein A2U01_0081641, partial [Trifolium medium]|nr:hypothetical protein [Trifolium medium]
GSGASYDGGDDFHAAGEGTTGDDFHAAGEVTTVFFCCVLQHNEN